MTVETVAKTPEPETCAVLSAVSHDLRNPLGTITLGSTLLLNQFGHEPRARRPLEMIQRSAQKMEAVLEMVTDMANLQAGQLELDWDEVSVGDVIDDALAGRQLEHPIQNVVIHCDRKRLGRVLSIALAGVSEPVRVHVQQSAGQTQIVLAETTPWRGFEQYMARSIIAAHGGELWTENGSVFITLPES